MCRIVWIVLKQKENKCLREIWRLSQPSVPVEFWMRESITTGDYFDLYVCFTLNIYNMNNRIKVSEETFVLTCGFARFDDIHSFHLNGIVRHSLHIFCTYSQWSIKSYSITKKSSAKQMFPKKQGKKWVCRGEMKSVQFDSVRFGRNLVWFPF